MQATPPRTPFAIHPATSAQVKHASGVDLFCLTLFVGYGLFRALMNVTYATGVGTTHPGTPLDDSLLYSLGTSVVMLVVSAALAVASWLRPSLRLRVPGVIGIGALCLASLVSALAAETVAAVPALRLVLCGVGGASWIVANAAWLARFAQLGSRRCLVTLVISMLLSSVVVIPIGSLAQLPQAVALCVIGRVSAALLWAHDGIAGASETQAGPGTRDLPTGDAHPAGPSSLPRGRRALGAAAEIWSPLVIYASMGMVLGLVTTFQASDGLRLSGHTLMKSLATMAACVVVVLVAFVGHSMPNVRRLFRISFPVVALALIILPFASPIYGIGFSVALATLNAVVSICTLFLLIEAARMWDIPVVTVTCVAMFAARLFLLAGLLVGRVVSAQDHLDATVQSLVVSVVALYLLSLALVALSRSRRRGTDAGPDTAAVPLAQVDDLVCPPGANEGPQGQEQAQARAGAGEGAEEGTTAAAGSGADKGRMAGMGMPPEDTAGTATPGITEREAVLDAYGLTPREVQIVELLAHGRSMAHAAQELGLATNTVRNYVQRIYEKLDVHSKQELIELLDQRGRAQDQPR